MRTLAKLAVPIAAALAIAAGAASAQQPPQQPPPQSGYGPGYGMGPGMMGGYGPGPGAGSRGGMAPGMMGGYGHGYGMGPGMMGGYGMGPEMMGGFGGGFGMGAGMMGPIWRLDLSDAQRSQIFKLQDESRRRNWELMGKLQDEYAKLRDAYLASGKRDRKAIVDAYKHIGDLRLQRIEVSLDTLDKLEAVLTPQQREQLKRWGPWWMRGAEQ